MPVKAGSDNDNRGPGGTPYIVFGFQGIIYAAQKGAAVINCSWGGPGASQFEQEIIDSAFALGSLVVCSAGNSGTQEANFPASYRNALSVTALSNADVRPSYANFGENIDVCAPGGITSGLPATDIFSTWFDNSYASIAGTSMAAPHAAGLAALVKSKFPSYSAIQIGEQVRVTCDDIYPQIPPLRININWAREESMPCELLHKTYGLPFAFFPTGQSIQ